MNSLSKRLKNIADPGRLKALALIAEAGELCVCEIEKALEFTPSTASRNLRELEDGGWLTGRREGRWVYYSLSAMDQASETLRDAVLNAYRQSPGAEEDLKRLRTRLSVGRETLCVRDSKAAVLENSDRN